MACGDKFINISLRDLFRLIAMVTINNKVYASVPVTTRNETKTDAYAQAMEYAKKIHYTIRVSSAGDLCARRMQTNENEHFIAKKLGGQGWR